MASDVTGGDRSPLFEKETRTALVLGLGFLFVFTSYNSLQNLQGSLNDESGLGVISLSCLYAAAILSAVYAPTVITVIGVKRSVMLAYTGHLVYVSSNFYPSFYTLIPSSIILGAVTGPLWTSQGIYLTSCALCYAERTSASLFSALSRINGIFFTLFELCYTGGNLLTSLILYQGQYNSTATISSNFCGSNDCPREETQDAIADPESSVLYILMGIFLGCVTAGLGTATLFLPSLDKQCPTSKNEITKSLVSCFKLILNSDIKFLLPLMFYIAFEQAFSSAEMTKSFISCPMGIQNVGYVMTAYGVCTTMCTFIFSRIAKYARRYILIGFAGSLQMALMVWMYHWFPTPQDWFKIYLLASLWGVAEGIWKPQTNVVLGDIFSESKQAAFAVYEGIKSIGFTVTFLYSSLLCVYIKLLIGMTFLTAAMILYATVEVRHARRGRKTGSIDIQSKTRNQTDSAVENYQLHI